MRLLSNVEVVMTSGACDNCINNDVDAQEPSFIEAYETAIQLFIGLGLVLIGAGLLFSSMRSSSVSV